MSRRTIAVDTLARVEGEGALDLVIRGDRVEKADFRIFEPPRFFEAFLRGRDFREAPDITARICGICPVAYLMGACHAMESICGVTAGCSTAASGSSRTCCTCSCSICRTSSATRTRSPWRRSMASWCSAACA
jgi:hypothetical protein